MLVCHAVWLCGAVWLCVAVWLCGSVWLSVALCGSVWLCVALCGQKWRSRVDAACSSSPKCCTCHAKSVSGQKPLLPSYHLKRQARKSSA